MVLFYLKGGFGRKTPCHPYFFLLCVEGLSFLLKNVVTNGIIHGFRISATGLAVTHFLFSYHSFLFFKATMNETNSTKEIIHSYEVFSWQAVNYQKSAIFSARVSEEINKRRLRVYLECLMVLGIVSTISSLIGISKVFKYLKDKVY